MSTSKEPKVNELLAKLKEGVQGVYTSDAWKAVLHVQSRFHNYSFGNSLLIYMQCPTATRVAGYDTWKKLGRQVVKGAKGIRIMAPHTYKVKNEQGEDVTKTGFHQTSVFDISQTTGEAIPTLCEELREDTQSLRDFYEVIKAASPVPVREEAITDGSKGYYCRATDDIAIKKGMAAKQKVKTAIHEIAHAILHRKDEARRAELTRNDLEIEAEGTAFVVCSHFGIDTSQYSFPYVASWSAGQSIDVILKTGEAIQKAANTIIQAIQAEVSVRGEEAA